MPIGLKVTEGQVDLSIAQIPSIGRQELAATDQYVAEVDGGNFGSGPRVSWYAVIYRPRTSELFKIGCWDGERGGYQPDLSGGDIPNCQLKVR